MHSISECISTFDCVLFDIYFGVYSELLHRTNCITAHTENGLFSICGYIHDLLYEVPPPKKQSEWTVRENLLCCCRCIVVIISCLLSFPPKEPSFGGDLSKRDLII